MAEETETRTYVVTAGAINLPNRDPDGPRFDRVEEGDPVVIL